MATKEQAQKAKSGLCIEGGCNNPRKRSFAQCADHLPGPAGRMCWFVDESFFVEDLGYRLSIVFENESGHRPNGTWPYNGGVGETLPYAAPTFEAAQEMCRRLNERGGISEQDAFDIVNRSMFGTTRHESKTRATRSKRVRS